MSRVPRPCPICDIMCSRASVLKRHFNTDHALNPKKYPCAICHTEYLRQDFKCKSPMCLALLVKPKIRYKGERAIASILDEMKLPYQHDKVYTPFHNKQRFDFIVWTDDTRTTPLAMIEYDGEGHFMPTKFGGVSNEKALQNHLRCVQHDAQKNEYCQANQYPLLRIPYTVRLNDIPQVVRDFIANPTNYVQPSRPAMYTPPSI